MLKSQQGPWIAAGPIQPRVIILSQGQFDNLLFLRSDGIASMSVKALIGKQFEAAKHANALMQRQMKEADKISKMVMAQSKM